MCVCVHTCTSVSLTLEILFSRFDYCRMQVAKSDILTCQLVKYSLYFVYRSGLQILPQNAKMHYNYGNLLADMGDIEGAVSHYKTAVRYVFVLDFVHIQQHATVNISYQKTRPLILIVMCRNVCALILACMCLHS